jgi:hypothetical protein
MSNPPTNGPVVFHDDGGPEGQTFGGYGLASELGRGGMGVVYKAVQHSLKRTVALKMLTGIVSREDLARFLSEAETAARLQHANIVHIYEVGEKDGVPFFAMEFVEGGSLADRVKAGPMAPREAARLMSTVARAVHFAHEHGVVHRDLKPANVLLDPSGMPKIADFGIAKRLDDDSKRTVTGAVMGTPGYMAPEQAEGSSRTAGPWSDVYSLGAMLYELLTGRPPFVPHESETPIYIRVISEPPVRPTQRGSGVPPELSAIAMMCLQKDRRDRFKSASELADDLDRFLNEEPIKAKPPPLLRRSWRWAKRHPWLVTGCLVLLAAATSGAHRLWRWEMYERLRVEHALAMNLRCGGIEPLGLVDEDSARRAFAHYRLTRQGRWGPVVALQVVNSKGKPAAVRQQLVDAELLQTWLQGAAGFGNVHVKGRREPVSLEVSYEDGEARELTGRDRNGLVTFRIGYKRISGEPGRATEGMGEFRNEKHFAFTMPGGASHFVFRRDDRGYDVSTRFFSGTGTPARNGEGVFGYEMRRNAAGQLELLRNVDAAGAPMQNVAGVTQVRFEYDARGLVVSRRYEDGDGRAVMVDGSALTRFTYDAAGNRTSIRRLLAASAAESRARAPAGESWHVIALAYGPGGELVGHEESRTGGAGGPVVLGRYESAHDANGYPSERRSIGSDGQIYWRSLLRYDERGNWTEDKTVYGDGTVDNWTRLELDEGGRARVTESLDPDGNVVERTRSVYEGDRLVRQTSEHADGTPRPVGYGHTRIDYAYHENGHPIEERRSGFANGELVLKVAFDELGRSTSETWVGAKDRPVTGPFGWLTRRITYRGSTWQFLSDSYEDAEGRPARHGEGPSTRRRTYDESGLLLMEVAEGFDGTKGYAARRVTYDVDGRESVIEHFGADGAIAREEGAHHRVIFLEYDTLGIAREMVYEDFDPEHFTYFRSRALTAHKNGHAQRIVMTFEDREGRPVATGNGQVKMEIEGDSRGRTIMTCETWAGPNASGAWGLRTENTWTESNRLQKRVRQGVDSAGRPVAASKNHEPSRIEETFDESGRTISTLQSGFEESVWGYSTLEGGHDAEGRPASMTHRRADGRAVPVHALVAEVSADAQEAAKNLRAGDVIVSVNGEPVRDTLEFNRRRAGKPGFLEVEREGKLVRIDGIAEGRIGISLANRAESLRR